MRWEVQLWILLRSPNNTASQVMFRRMFSMATALWLHELTISAYPVSPEICIIDHQQFCRCAI